MSNDTKQKSVNEVPEEPPIDGEPVYEDLNTGQQSSKPIPYKAPIKDERTGQEIEAGGNNQIPALQSLPSYENIILKAGTLPLSAEELAILTAPLDPADIQIRPDGLIYLPWPWYVRRLNKGIGVLQWANIPRDDPRAMPQGEYGDMLVVWPHWLIIRGIVIGMAEGETTYKPKNATMSFADAAEGAKSIALVRNCKFIGMALELYDHDFAEEWKKKYAETYPNPNTQAKQKMLWRKKTVQVDPVVTGRNRLLQQLVPTFYVDRAAIAEQMKLMELVYSVEKHDEIVRALASKALEKKPE